MSELGGRWGDDDYGVDEDVDAPAPPYRWLRIGLTIVNVVVLLIGAGLIWFSSTDSVVAHTPDAAVEEFRGQASTPDLAGFVDHVRNEQAATAAAAGGGAAPAASAPPPAETPPAPSPEPGAAPAPPAPSSWFAAPPPAGVYRYKTTGGESVDVLSGANHEYPEETVITVRHTGCGFETEWRPLQERWEKRLLCGQPGGLHLAALAGQREFFGRKGGHASVCDPGTYYVAIVNGAPPESWSGLCRGQQSEVHFQFRLVERGPRTVGSATVDTVTFELTTGRGQEGASYTRVHAIVTVTADTGLPVAIESTTTAVVQSPSGSGRYDEHYTIELIDLTPRT